MILIEHDSPPKGLPRRELRSFLAEAVERVSLPGEVNVLLADDARLQELNQAFRRKNKPTDVLSFPSPEGDGGDLAISLDTAARQAAEIGHALADEVKILILHGLLHLAGYDHETDTGQMGRKEARLRREYGLPMGLIQRAGVSIAVPKVGKVKPAGAGAGAKRGMAASTLKVAARKVAAKGAAAGKAIASNHLAGKPVKKAASKKAAGTGKAASAGTARARTL